MPVGIVYAIWCGAGIIFSTVIGWVWFRQALDLPALAGMG
jgi:small multidrug resistance pump